MKKGRLIAFAVVFAGAVQFAAAQATGLAVFQQNVNVQTGGTTTQTGYFGALRVDLSGTPSDPTDATGLTPNGQLDTLVPNGSTQLLYQTGYLSLSDLNAQFGPGLYTFTAPGSLIGQVSTPADMWAPSAPVITNWAALSSMNPNVDFTLNFTGFTQDLSANYSATFIGITDLTTNTFVVGSSNGLAPVSSFNSYTILAGMLAPNNSYQIVIDDDNRLIGTPQSGFQGATPYSSFDMDTQFTFNSTPEPAPVAIMALGVLGLLIRRKNRAR